LAELAVANERVDVQPDVLFISGERGRLQPFPPAAP
jgi:hypothetical protein